MPNSQIHN